MARKLDKNGNPIITQKELDESGLSLRDFLNKERGLTRKPPEGMTREYKPRDFSRQEAQKADSKEAGMSRGTRSFAGSSRGQFGGASVDELSRFNAGKPGYDEAGTSVMMMKRGGKVPSASSRADGIAQRGKTRGVMVACGGGYMKGKK